MTFSRPVINQSACGIYLSHIIMSLIFFVIRERVNKGEKMFLTNQRLCLPFGAKPIGTGRFLLLPV